MSINDEGDLLGKCYLLTSLELSEENSFAKLFNSSEKSFSSVIWAYPTAIEIDAAAQYLAVTDTSSLVPGPKR